MSFLLESSSPKKNKLWLPLAVFVALLVALAGVGSLNQPAQVGVLEINGVIMDSKVALSQIKILSKDPQILGVLVRINSPGGAVAPSQEIFTALADLSKRKPVYASMGSIAASGGYYISLGANQVFANPGTLTGSIGVIIESPNVSDLMKKLGVSIEVVKSGKNKDAGSPFRSMKPEERNLLNTVIMDTYEQFIEAILSRRKMDETKLREVADGRIFTGRQAKALGLIDQLGGYNEALAALVLKLGIKGEFELIQPPDPEHGILSRLQNEATSTITGLLAPSGGLMYMSPLTGRP